MKHAVQTPELGHFDNALDAARFTQHTHIRNTDTYATHTHTQHTHAHTHTHTHMHTQTRTHTLTCRVAELKRAGETLKLGHFDNALDAAPLFQHTHICTHTHIHTHTHMHTHIHTHTHTHTHTHLHIGGCGAETCETNSKTRTLGQHPWCSAVDSTHTHTRAHTHRHTHTHTCTNTLTLTHTHTYIQGRCANTRGTNSETGHFDNALDAAPLFQHTHIRTHNHTNTNTLSHARTHTHTHTYI